LLDHRSPDQDHELDTHRRGTAARISEQRVSVAGTSTADNIAE
jgi:hypothetical protein